jgi:hypothetical protein
MTLSPGLTAFLAAAVIVQNGVAWVPPAAVSVQNGDVPSTYHVVAAVAAVAGNSTSDATTADPAKKALVRLRLGRRDMVTP